METTEVDELLRELTSRNWRDRALAASKLGKLPIADKRVTDALRVLSISDSDKLVRGVAAKSLQSLKDVKGSEPLPVTSETRESKALPIQIGGINASANLAILNFVVTLPVAIMQFLIGDEDSLVAGVINTIVAFTYLLVSFRIRNRDVDAYKAGLSMSKWGMLWTLGLSVYSINQYGGIGFVVVVWFLADAWMYKTLKSAESTFLLATIQKPPSENVYLEEMPREKEERSPMDDRDRISARLQKAESLARAGEFEKAAEELEFAYQYKRRWAKAVAGFRTDKVPASGYALLVELAGKEGKSELATRYFIRMLELNPEQPELAQQVAVGSGIKKEAQAICEKHGIRWAI